MKFKSAEGFACISPNNQAEVYWSGRADLNRGPPAPKAGALPGCATPRLYCFTDSKPLPKTCKNAHRYERFRFVSFLVQWSETPVLRQFCLAHFAWRNCNVERNAKERYDE